jgi:hypothetical protein
MTHRRGALSLALACLVVVSVTRPDAAQQPSADTTPFDLHRHNTSSA